jgi:RNA polymerase sigma factor (sigma-70 family)
MMETDENLMLAVRNGDVAKLGVLFDRHHRTLFDFFIRMTGLQTVADDLVQDVFFRILKYRKTFRDESWFKAWMFHIARNARFDYYRSHRGEGVLEDGQAEEVASPSPLPGQQLEHQQQAMLLECAMFKLSPEKREVLVLSRYQDMKYEQIAELMGCEVGTVKTRVHRALKELRDNFLRLSSEKPTCNVKKSENRLRIM